MGRLPQGREASGAELRGRPEAETTVVSACLLGVRCRYDGSSRDSPEMLSRLAHTLLVPVCPEQLGGLPTPRSPCRLQGGSGADVLAGRAHVVDDSGADMTAAFLRGAQEAVGIARRVGATRARDATTVGGADAPAEGSAKSRTAIQRIEV